MSENKPTGRVPDLLVERLLLGELDEEQARAVRQRLDEEPGGRERLEQLARANEEVLLAHPPARVARDIADRLRVEDARERERAPERRSRAWWVAVPALAAALLVVVVLTPRASQPGGVVGEEVILTKGAAPRLRVFTPDAQGARELSSGDTAHAGQVLQVAYVASGETHGVVLSVDGRGQVTLHLPEHGSEAARLASSGLVRLPHAYELDDAPGFERFFFVSSSSPFATDEVVDAARTLAANGGAREAPLPLPAGLTQVSFLVAKDDGARER